MADLEERGRAGPGTPRRAGWGRSFGHIALEVVLISAGAFVLLAVIDAEICWLFFVRMRPRFLVLPGTEGLAGYGDYGSTGTLF